MIRFLSIVTHFEFRNSKTLWGFGTFRVLGLGLGV